MSAYCSKCYPKGEIEVDESYFGGRRIKGKRQRGAFKKIPVFGILKRGRKVYTEINDSTFCLDQKEREFRFNLGDTDIHKMLSRMLRDNRLSYSRPKLNVKPKMIDFCEQEKRRKLRQEK